MSEISVRLGLLRVERQLSQQQLADRTGLRRDTISALERGKSQGIDFSTLARLCDALSCTPNDLLEVATSAHVVPVLGGVDEDATIAERLAEIDLDALIADPGLVGDDMGAKEDASGYSLCEEAIAHGAVASRPAACARSQLTEEGGSSTIAKEGVRDARPRSR